MAKDENGARAKRREESVSDPEEGSKRSESSKHSRRSRHEGKRGRSSSSRKSRDEEDESYTSSSDSDSLSDSDSYSDLDSGSSDEFSESDDERRWRKRKERKRREEREREREKEKEKKRRRRKEKERKRRRKEREEKEEKKRKKRKKKDNDKGKKGAVTNSWGKYGIIRETDMWTKRPEFTAWLAEVKKVNLESLPNWEEKQMFKEFMEDHNTATFPSKKYYDLDAYYRHQMEKEKKKGFKKVRETERTVFDDEEQRRLELRKERERQKEEQVEALKCSMQGGMAQAMKEQAQLREEMAYLFKIGNHEAAAAIQRRLDPDVPM